MATATLETKKTMLRAALLNMDQKGELGKVAYATGISGGVETLREMINDPSKKKRQEAQRTLKNTNHRTAPRAAVRT